MRLANWWIFLLILVRTDHFSDGLCTSRRFANRILNRGVLHLSDNVASDVEIEYAPMTPKDIPKLAKMISKYFDGPYSWWQRPSEIYSVWTLECQLSDRFEKFMVHKERQHVMLVARVEGEAIGYVEVGLVPLSQELRDAGESALNMQWGQTGMDERTMFPYVGNVVVDESFRRKGIAFSLMNQALQSTKDWGVTYAFCAVHTENEAASDLYLNKLGFKIFRLEENGGSFFSIDKRSRYILVKQFHDTNIDGEMGTMLPNFLGDEIIDEDDVDEDVDIDIEDTEIEADTDYYSD